MDTIHLWTNYHKSEIELGVLLPIIKLNCQEQQKKTSAHSFQHDSLNINSFSVISQSYLSEITIIIHIVRMLKGFTERVKAKEVYSPSLKYPELWTLHKSMLTQDFWFDLDRHHGSDFYPDSESSPKFGNYGCGLTLRTSRLQSKAFPNFPSSQLSKV